MYILLTVSSLRHELRGLLSALHITVGPITKATVWADGCFHTSASRPEATSRTSIGAYLQVMHISLLKSAGWQYQYASSPFCSCSLVCHVQYHHWDEYTKNEKLRKKNKRQCDSGCSAVWILCCSHHSVWPSAAGNNLCIIAWYGKRCVPPGVVSLLIRAGAQTLLEE